MIGREVNLLRSLPQTNRNVQTRATSKTAEIIAAAKAYGELYFDGPREYGYGGYKYDGRWKPVALDIINQFQLGGFSRVLDVGCAKGFLVHDLMEIGPDGFEAFGLDVSWYALTHCMPSMVGRLHFGNAINLPFPGNSFDCVLSINTLHNLPREGVIRALSEIQRISGGRAFVQVDSYRTPEQKALFEQWVLTAEFHDYPEGWLQVFKEAGYTGDYYWTIVE